jgi:hypothetical protein
MLGGAPMAGPPLPVNIDTTYADSGTDTSVQIHQYHHDLIHGVVRNIDTAIVGTAGYVPIGNGAVLVTRALLSTDNPGIVVNTRTASYTLVLTDAGKLVEMNVASANTLTVPLNASAAFPFSPSQTVINIRQYGAGTTTIGGSATIRSRGGLLALAGPYAEATLTKRATDEWVLSGDLA